MMLPGEVPAVRALANWVSTSGAAREGGVDERSSASAEASATTAMHVVELDVALAARVERELADFAARGEPVAAEQRHERGARIRRDRETGGAHLLVDQTRELASPSA